MRCLTVLLNETAPAAAEACVRQRQRRRQSYRRTNARVLSSRLGSIFDGSGVREPPVWHVTASSLRAGAHAGNVRVELRCLASRRQANWDVVTVVSPQYMPVADGSFRSAFFAVSINTYGDLTPYAAAAVR